MTAVKLLQELLVAVSVMRADLLALLQQVRCATCALQHVADLGRSLDGVLCLSAGLQDISKDLNQMFGGRTLLFPQALQFLLRPIRQFAHAFDEHLYDLIARLDGGLMDQAHQQRQSLGSREVPYVRRMQRPGFLGEMRDLGQADTLDQALLCCPGTATRSGD